MFNLSGRSDGSSDGQSERGPICGGWLNDRGLEAAALTGNGLRWQGIRQSGRRAGADGNQTDPGRARAGPEQGWIRSWLRSTESERHESRERKLRGTEKRVNVRDEANNTHELAILKELAKQSTATRTLTERAEVKKLTELTFAVQRRHINTLPPTDTEDLKTKWPFLFMPRCIYAHFELLTDINVLRSLELDIEECGRAITQYFLEKPTNKAVKDVISKGEDNELSLRVVQLLMSHFGEHLTGLILLADSLTKDSTVSGLMVTDQNGSRSKHVVEVPKCRKPIMEKQLLSFFSSPSYNILPSSSRLLYAVGDVLKLQDKRQAASEEAKRNNTTYRLDRSQALLTLRGKLRHGKVWHVTLLPEVAVELKRQYVGWSEQCRLKDLQRYACHAVQLVESQITSKKNKTEKQLHLAMYQALAGQNLKGRRPPRFRGQGRGHKGIQRTRG
ncbi:unnamed protein product [Menidia menidia]|uniref:(Atlantic silverside) hypothetical protein n=1 Tax=Menidia menidia TaxID=238744 RepID=A0A8S4AHD1_9TELE|nr:unnamed protein product [Menidia menidia]